MAEFNYTEYLRNNPLMAPKGAKTTLTENQRPGYHADGTPKSNDEMSDDEREDFYMNLDSVEEEKSSTKMKKSELKAKIKEDILATLQEENSSEPVKEMTGEVYNRIDGLIDQNLKAEFIDKFISIQEDFIESGDEFDALDVIDYLASEMQKYTAKSFMGENQSLENELMSQLDEAKDDEEEDEEEVDFEDEIEDEEGEDVGGGDADAIDPEAGLSQDEQDIQNALKVAFDNATAIGDDKLADQIGNTITMFTRTHVVNR